MTTSDTKQLEDGRLWTRRPFGKSSYAYESEDKTFDIAALPNGAFRLISFSHEEDADGNPWNRDFRTIEEAMTYAEKM